jgi:hypothetical protein
MNTDMNGVLFQTNPELEKHFSNDSLLKRMGNADELNGALIYLRLS